MSTLLERLRQALTPDYEVREELASGGMGSVFLARDTRLDRQVAIKVLRPEAADATAAERFVREARVLASLKHPNIVPIYQAGEEDGLSYYVMELVEGETLAHRLKRGALPLHEALRLADDLLSALQVAHENGIIHRDVKPANIFLRDDRALLGDFGIAKRAEESEERLTMPDRVIGTPAYMAPEQLSAEDVTPATDVYAAGMVLYEALTGRRWSVLETGDLADWSRVPSGLHPALRRALHTSPEARWKNAAAFREDLTRAAGRRRYRKWAAAAAVSITVMVVAIAGALQLLRTSGASVARGDRVAVAIFSNQTGDPGLDGLGVMAADWVTQGLTETRLAAVVPVSGALYYARENPRQAGAGGDLAAAIGLGRSARANIVVAGAYYLDGDSLLFRADLIDPERGEIIVAVPAVRGALQQEIQVVDTLRDQIMVALATVLDVKIKGTAGIASQPPTFAAYQEYVTGLELLIEWDAEGALPHFYNAFRNDSSFTLAIFLAILAHAVVDFDHVPAMDTLQNILAARRNSLPPLESVLLDWYEADWMDDEIQQEYEFMRRVVDLAPEPLFVMLFMQTASELGRYRTVLDLLARVDPEVNYARKEMSRTVAGAYHALGAYDQELEEARVGRESHLRGFAEQIEVRALAAEGRMEELRSRIDQYGAVSQDHGWSLDDGGSLPLHWAYESLDGLDPQERSEARRMVWKGDLYEIAALELYAHGHDRAAGVILEDAIRWYRTLPAIRGGMDVPCYGWDTAARALECRLRKEYGRILYLAKRWDESKAVYTALTPEPDPNKPRDCRRNLAMASARGGDAHWAVQLLPCFTEFDFPVQTEVWQARVAALLGRKEEAVGYLRRLAARRGGAVSFMNIHRDFDLLNLHGYPAFEELLEDRG